MMRSLSSVLIVLVLIASAGCGSSEFHELTGKVTLENAPGFAFAGDVLELRLEGEPLQRAFGEIQPDGTFKVETLHDGKIAGGIRPGIYQARIVLADDDLQHVQRASRLIHRKFTRFETSTLKLQVPTENVVLQLPAK